MTLFATVSNSEIIYPFVDGIHAHNTLTVKTVKRILVLRYSISVPNGLPAYVTPPTHWKADGLLLGLASTSTAWQSMSVAMLPPAQLLKAKAFKYRNGFLEKNCNNIQNIKSKKRSNYRKIEVKQFWQ